MKKYLGVIGLIWLSSPILTAQEMSEYISSGDVAYVEGKFEDAKKYYEKAQSMDIDNADYMTAFQLGQCCQKLQQYDQALNYFTKSIIKGNDDKSLLTKMKQCAESQKCTSCLETAYAEVKKVVPQWSALMQEKLFYVYSAEKNNQKALHAALIVLASNPKQFAMLRNVGLIWNGMNRPDSAIYYLDKANQIKPEDATTNKVLGLLYYHECEAKMKAENQRYEKLANKGRSQYNTLLYNRQNLAKTYYPKAIHHLTEANKTLNEAEIQKLIARMNNNLKVLSK